MRFYTLTEWLEMDECYVGMATEKKVKEEFYKRKGSQRKAQLAVSV